MEQCCSGDVDVVVVLLEVNWNKPDTLRLCRCVLLAINHCVFNSWLVSPEV